MITRNILISIKLYFNNFLLFLIIKYLDMFKCFIYLCIHFLLNLFYLFFQDVIIRLGETIFLVFLLLLTYTWLIDAIVCFWGFLEYSVGLIEVFWLFLQFYVFLLVFSLLHLYFSFNLVQLFLFISNPLLQLFLISLNLLLR